MRWDMHGAWFELFRDEMLQAAVLRVHCGPLGQGGRLCDRDTDCAGTQCSAVSCSKQLELCCAHMLGYPCCQEFYNIATPEHLQRLSELS